jgi:hypothetical protein
MKRFLSVLIASFFLASGAVYAAEKMEDTKEKKADSKSKDGKSKTEGKSKDDKAKKYDKAK